MKTRLLPLLVAFALGVAACGGSDSEGASAETDTDTATETTETGADADAEAATTAPPATATPLEETTTVLTATVDATAYCEFEDTDLINDLPEDATPEEVEAAYTETFAQLQALEGNVPAEIADDFGLAVGAFDALMKLLASNNWDVITTFDSGALDEVMTENINQAFDNLDAFAEANCESDETTSETIEDNPGEELGDPFAAGLSPEDLEVILSTEVGRQAFIDSFATSSGMTEDQAVCFIDNTSYEQMAFFAAQDMDNVDLGAFLETLDTCGIPLEALGG